MSKLRLIILLMPLLLANTSEAGLLAIKPRPQQMGIVAAAPMIVDGALWLVMPDNPTAVEAIVRDEIVAKLTQIMLTPPIVVPFSEWDGGQASLWVGTPARFPALLDSLSASQLPGFGVLSHQEEYQLLVTENTIFLAGYDQLGMQWGLKSLLKLIASVNGVHSIDRACIRDYPDFPKRICTINSSVRTTDQTAYCDSTANMAYEYKMDEIEWNDPDAGNPVRSDYAVENALAVRAKIARHGQFLTIGVDRTAMNCQELRWQEGVPILNESMTVGTSYLTTNSYGVNPSNNGFETWSGNVPIGWSMYPNSSYATISRDNTQRHTGTSSVRWLNMDPGYDFDRTVHQRMRFGAHRLHRISFWAKTSGFHGRLRCIILGDEPVYNHFENRRFSIGSTADWTQFSFEFSTFNDDSASIWVGPEEYASGTLWIDDVSLSPAGLMNMVRRDNTPLQVYKQPGNLLMTEGVDYSVSELYSFPETDYVVLPRINKLAGGALVSGNTVTVNYHTAIIFQGGRETVCFSELEPLEYYQSQIANVDSALSPEGFKIHINEVTLAGYDPLCTSRGLSPGQLCGWHCDQLYDIIQARLPGSPVRIYGDAFDIWVEDNRCHPVQTSPWTAGALQQLAPQVEIMAMSDYSKNLDSSFAYFNANGHNAVMAYYGSEGFQEAVDGAISARHAPNCTGFEFYDWDITVFDKLLDFSCLGWNFGPFFTHDPLDFSTRPDTIRLTFEAWSDSFRLNVAPTITSRSLSYRFLPGGSWTTVTPAALGANRYRSLLPVPANASTIEYYFRATDHRNQSRYLPPDAPSRVFSAAIPPGTGNDDIDPREYDRRIQPRISGNVITWPEVQGASGYEIHWSLAGDVHQRRQTLLSVVPAGQTSYFMDPSVYQNMSSEYLFVTPIWAAKSPAAATARRK